MMAARLQRQPGPWREPADPTHGRTRTPGRRRGLVPDQELVLSFQRQAGNAAVAAALSSRKANTVTSVDAVSLTREGKPPEKGLKEIRDLKKGAGIVGYTTRQIENSPPILMPEQPVKSAAGYTTKAMPVSNLPEPEIREWWPTKGRHKIAEHQYVDIEDTWPDRLMGGEDEHGKDAVHAWELTWKKAAGIINSLAKKPGPAAATPEDAEKELWGRYVAALPKDMQPEGEKPTIPAQLDVMAARGGTFFAWLWETTVVRDTREYHTPGTKPVSIGKDTVSTLEDGKSKLPGPEAKDLIAEVRPKYTKGRKIIGSELE